MDESEDNMSCEDLLTMESPFLIKTKPKKRSLVERELETSLTARVTSPVSNCDSGCSSRYGRARRLKTNADYIDTEKGIKITTSPVYVKIPDKTQSPVYKMHASNSPIKTEPKETPQKVIATDSSLDNQIENIYHENILLSRFGSEEKKNKSPGNTFPKVYVRKDLIQSREKEEYVMMIKNMYSPVKSSQKSYSHLNNILERSSEKYCLNSSTGNSNSHNSSMSNSSVVKTLDFDVKKKKENRDGRDGKVVLSKNDLFELEAKCEYQVGDLAWARMGTFPFWPCIVTREPVSGMFVKKKLFGRIERDIIHVTFFGDNGRRGWIVDTMLRRFLGQLEFEATKNAFNPSAKKKDPRLYAAFFVSEKKMPQWNISVEEAETLLREPKRLRIDILYDMLAMARSSKCTPKQQKSEKITRTASDVASDVSLSESLYDTLFSEDDGKTEDTERSRSKTRMSLDVSEVVTACLDNMAAKTGITKIQRQSHMDRWLQKAKSKTPEKLQLNLPLHYKEKEIKAANAKKKKKLSPIRVPVQKHYRLRKSSYEPQILKSHDNEHDYSTKISNEPLKTSDESTANPDFGGGLSAKAESLNDIAGESVNCALKGEQTNKDVGTSDCSKALKKTHTDVSSQETKHSVDIGLNEENVEVIQENMCSVEENDELLLGYTDKPIEISQILDDPSKGEENPIKDKQIANKPSVDEEKQSEVVKMPSHHSMHADKQVLPHKHKKDVRKSAEMTKKTDEHRLRTKKFVEVTQKIADHKVDIEKQIKITQTPDIHPSDTKKPIRNTRVAAIENKITSDTRQRSPEFAKYLELRQDSLIDEHPELSQDEIEDYLYKTWQYEESSKSDLRKNDDSKNSGLIKGLKIKKNKKCLSLSLKSKRSNKKQNEDKLPINSFLSDTLFKKSLESRLLNSPNIAIGLNEKISYVTNENSTVKAIESIQIVTEHSYTEKHPETTLKLDEYGTDTPILSKDIVDKVKTETLLESGTPIRRSLRSKLSKSPANAINTHVIVSSGSQESSSEKTIESAETEHCYTEENTESKQNRNELGMNIPKLDIDKVKIETTLIEGGTPVRRSKLSNPPDIAMDSNARMSNVSKEIITAKAIKSDQTVTEHCYAEKHLETTQQLNEEKMDLPKLYTHNINEEKIERLIEVDTPIRRSSRAKLLNSPAIAMDSNNIIINKCKESSTVKAIKCNQKVTEHCYTEKHPETTPQLDEHEMNLPKLNIDKEKMDSSLIECGISIRRSRRAKLSKSPAIATDSNNIIINESKESSTVKAIECNQIVTEHSETTPQLNEHEMDPPKLNIDKEKIVSSLIEGGISIRRSRRAKLSNSPAIALGSNHNIMINESKESNTVKRIECNQIVTEHCYMEKHHETTPQHNEHEMDSPKLLKRKIDKEITETSLIENGTPVRKSLRSKLTIHPAISIDKNEITSNVKKESSTSKTIENAQTVTEHCNTKKLPETAQGPEEFGIEKPKLSEYNTDKGKKETTLIVGGTSARRSLRSKLPNAPTIFLDTSLEMINSVSKERSMVKTEGGTQIVNENSHIEKHSETIPKTNEHETDTSKLSEFNIKIEKIETPLIAGNTSAKRSRRTRLSNSLAMSIDTNEKISSVSKANSKVKADNSTVKVIETTKTVPHCCSEKHPEMAQKPHEDQTDATIQAENKIKKEKSTAVVDKHDTSIEKLTEITQVAEEPRIDGGKQEDTIQSVNEHSNGTENQVGTALVPDERCMNTEKQIDILKLTDVQKKNTEKLPDAQMAVEHGTEIRTDAIQKAGGLNITTKLPIKITALTHESCFGTEKSKQTDVIKKSDVLTARQENSIEIKDKMGSSCTDSKKRTDVAQSVNIKCHSTDTINQAQKIKDTYGHSSNENKAVEITKLAHEPSVHTEKQAQIMLVMNEHPIQNDQADLDEDKEYGHLDFVFSGLNEKLFTTNNVNKSLIENFKNVSNEINSKDTEMAASNIVVESEKKTPNNINPNNNKRNWGSSNVKSKYKNLYDSCTNLRVRVERLPRLSHKIINIKNIENKMLFSNARQNKVINKIDRNDKNEQVVSKIISKDLINNGKEEAICIAHTMDNIILNAAIAMDDESIKDIVNKNSLENVKANMSKENLTNEKDSKDNSYDSEVFALNQISDEKVSSDIPESNQNDQNIVTDMNTLAKKDLLLNENDIEHNQENLIIQPVTFVKEVSSDIPESKQTDQNIVTDINTLGNNDLLLEKNHIEHNQKIINIPLETIVKSETGECLQIKPSPIINGYEYIFDDDEDEFESPAFSPIFKEPIDTTLGEKEHENEENNDLETTKAKNDINKTDNTVVKDASTELSVKEELVSSTENKIQENYTSNDISALTKEQNDVSGDKDALMTSVSRLPEPVKINGFHLDEYGLDFSDNDLNVETSSINSEDSEPLAVTKSKLLSKKRKDAKKASQDMEFVKYMELRQDALMDEHPELNHDEMVDYLYKTWQYEENAKSEIIKNDDIEQAGLVKGLNDNLRQKSIRNSYRANKKINKKRDDDTLSINSNISKKRSKKQDDDSLSITSDISDTSIRQRLRTRLSNSPAISMDESEFCVSKDSSPERKPHIEDTVSMDSYDSIKITKRKVRNQILDDSLDGEEGFFVLKEKTENESSLKITIKKEESRSRRTLEKRENKSPKSNNDTNIRKYFSVVNSPTETKTNYIIEQDTIIDVNKKVKEEYDPETVSITSINSEDSEVSLSKRKQRKNAEKQTAKTMDEPEFLKYVELRQDVLIDENPQLTHKEIVGYLYKTWLYEESAKSDLKKSDDIEQANLVKGLNTEVQPKKLKKKIKVEKYPDDEEVTLKDKPRRKTSQPFYYEDMSDIEEEIELFEIFKTAKKSNAIKSEKNNEDINKAIDIKSSDVKTEVEEIVIQDEIDEVELYFTQLPQPKPNVFKGFVREKVCEICEKTGNLIKCKGCSGMFHAECEQKVKEEVVVASTRGRKKKKKPGRKPKNFEDSESHSDEKSQDVSEENNSSIEEIETKPRVVDEAILEAALTAKMKELLPTIDLTYDSYSSDDGLDWNSALPGHCEIVDVKLKPKTVVDYSDFKCKNCQRYSAPVCFVCKEAVSKTGVDHRQKCQTNHCNKYYHLECLDHWPQTQFNSGEPSKINKKINEHFEPLMCPRHVCHTCVSDDPRGCKTRFSGDKLARCVKCPATYHSFTKCLPAGTQILTGSLIVCPRHYEQRSGKVPCHVNTGWCFICALGGSLICCEYCPTSFHAECLNIKPPEGGYMCEDCETGRLPLYGEIVWVKLGHYRWWPGIILHPSEIPENIMAVKHSPGEFVVRFFGQYDHYWVNRGRVFPFQEGDSGRISTQKSKIDAAFITAMEHAHRAFEILKNAQPNDEESIDIASSLLPPHYVKLKVNKPCGSLVGRRPDIEESSLTQCECDPQVEDPCGPYSHCLNRMLLTECGPICRAGDRCSNRAFEKRLYPKMVPYRTPHRGWGLKTLEDIKAGQFVIEYVGELLDEEEFKRRMNRMHEIRDENFYFLTLDKERMIDAGPKGNLARFMNHCCEPNCETQKWTVLGDVRVGLFAIYDIPANSELTFNYNLECTGIEKKRCMCGARRCSGYIGAKPKQEETQPKKKRAYKKRAKPVEESPTASKNKPKRPVGRPAKPRELTEIEKDLLIIKNATNGISSDSECSSRLSSIDNNNPKALKRRRVSFSTEESVCSSPSTKKVSEDSSPSTKKARIEDTVTSPSAKKMKIEEKSEVGD